MEFPVLRSGFIYLVIALTVIAAGCRKDVELDLPEYKQKVVIEASIEEGGLALVFLSYSVPYFGEFDYSAPEKAFIKGAKITVTDGKNMETLREFDPNYGYVYGGTTLRGEVGKTYTLSVQVNGELFETSTTIPAPVPLDSLYFKTEFDSLGFIYQKLSEPAGSGQYYRWFSKREHRDFFFAAPYGSVFDDKFIDGKTFEFGFDRGTQPNQSGTDPERGYFKEGDTVIVKFCTMGRREFDFWNTYYQNKSSNGNPFSAPTNVQSMYPDHERCFGAFVGYGVFLDTLAIPKK